MNFETFTHIIPCLQTDFTVLFILFTDLPSNRSVWNHLNVFKFMNFSACVQDPMEKISYWLICCKVILLNFLHWSCSYFDMFPFFGHPIVRLLVVCFPMTFLCFSLLVILSCLPNVNTIRLFLKLLFNIGFHFELPVPPKYFSYVYIMCQWTNKSVQKSWITEALKYSSVLCFK